MELCAPFKSGEIPLTSPVTDVITTSASFVPSLLVGYRKVYSVRCEADVVMTSATGDSAQNPDWGVVGEMGNVSITIRRRKAGVHRLSQFPSHVVSQISETLWTYPTTVILGDITLCECIRWAGFPELGPASFAMVMVPIFPWARILHRAQHRPTRPLRVVDPPIRHLFQRYHIARLNSPNRPQVSQPGDFTHASRLHWRQRGMKALSSKLACGFF
jgi:hypothetical protein